MYTNFDYYSLSLLLGGIVAIFSGGVVYIADKKKIENIAWLLLNIATSIWSFGYFFMITTSDAETAILSNRVLHAGAIFIPAFYTFFIATLTKSLSKKKAFFIGFSLIVIFFQVINFSELFVKSVIPKFIFNFAPDAGPFYIYFAIYFFSSVIISFYFLIKKILTSNPNEKPRLKSVLYSSAVGFIGGGSVFFLTFNIQIPPYPIVLFSFYPIIIAYAMLRYKLFNIKVVATQILVASIWIILLFRTLLSNNLSEQLVSVLLLLFTVLTGVLLIRNVFREVEQREKIEELSDQKSEFMSFAAHELRNPLTSIKGITSEILEGDFGDISPVLKDAAGKIFIRSNDVVQLIQQYLDKSKFELDQIQYQMDIVNLKDITTKLIEDFKHHLELHKAVIEFNADNGPHLIYADKGKIQEVVGNLIDNSIKYSPDNSHIKISLTRNAGMIALHIKDNGIGISKEVQEKLFQKFARAADARKVNIKGSGLGLYLAKQFMEGHKGRIWVESEGEGKGSTFSIELPAAPETKA